MYTLKSCVVFLLLISGVFGLDSSESEATTETNDDNQEDDGDDDDISVRLPQNLVPLYYKLDFIPFLEKKRNFSISAKMWIDVKCTQPTKVISLHGVNLVIKEATVRVVPVEKAELPVQKEGQGEAVTGVKYDDTREFINITVASSLEAGQLYRISMEYTGKIRDDLVGFYKSGYFDKERNATRYVGITQFQATYARMAFPCFDEPELKAKFEVSLGRRIEMSSLSNTELRKTEPIPGNEGWVWDHYHKSLVMSSYLVAFSISEFESDTATKGDSKLEFRVWARKDAVDQTEYAKTVGPKLMTFYEEYFGLKYQMQKMDMIAIPDMDGAMENWGLVTYEEKYMLCDPNVTNDRAKMDAALTIGHELAHQWTGNLVTMKWWSDLWLNEGFAQYIQYIGVNHISPEWNIFQYFMSDEMHYVFQLDSLSTSHSVIVDVEYPDEIDEIFDDIIYNKGASLIRMMSHFLTESTFNKGLHHYLKKWEYKSTLQNDLWHSLTKQAHEDGTLVDTMTVHQIMESWTLQKGYPVINVVRNYTSNTVTFTQIKFQLHKDSMNASQLAMYKWWVPISTATPNSNENFLLTIPTLWLNNDTASSTHQLDIDNSSWLITNAQQTGYYRVNYDTQNWNLIISQLISSHTAIHVINRAQIIDDAFNLARAGQLSYKIVFKLTKYITNEFEPLPWYTLLTAFDYIDDMLSNSTTHKTFNEFVRKILKKQLDHVGYADKSEDSHQTKLHRMKIVDWACQAEDPGCSQHAIELFAQWMNQSNPDDCNPISKNLRGTIYTVAINSGGEAEWDFLWERYLQSNVASDQETILTALGNSEDPWLLDRYLNWSTSTGHGIRKQNVDTVFTAVASNPIGNFVAFKFIRENALQMKDYLNDAGGVNDQVATVASSFKTQVQLEELENLVEHYRDALGGSSSILKRTIESIRANVLWSKDNFDSISKWLAQEVKGKTDDQKFVK